MTRFATVLDTLSPMDSGFSAEVPPDWAQGRAIFGGLLTGLGLRALDRVLPAERSIRSVLASFVGPVLPGRLEVQVEILRQGRALTQAQVRLLQEGEVRAVLLVASGASRPTTIPWAAGGPPPTLPLEELANLPYIEGFTPTCTQHFRYRWSEGSFPFSGADRPEVGGFVRFAEPTPLDAAGLLALVDAWPAPVLPLASRVIPASTVTWMVDLPQALPPGGLPADGWCRFSARTAVSADGYADVVGRLWGPDGSLLATSRQLVAEFSARG